MRRLLGHGWSILLLCSLVLVIEMMGVLGWSRYQSDSNLYLTSFPDTTDYLQMANLDLTDPEGLRGIRTWGFPLLLKLVRTFSPDYALLPWVHLVLHVGAVLVLYAGLRQVGFPMAAAVLVCLPCLFADLITGQLALHHILTDALGHALLLTTFGAFFLVLARPEGPWRWLLFTLAVFATYQTRPAYQCLVLLIPVCGLFLTSFLLRPRAKVFFIAGLALSSFSPYLAFCTLRYFTVGHFGLVAFTGTNLIGITSVVLTEDMVPHLHPEHRPLAETILAGRASPGVIRRLYDKFEPPIPPGGTLWDLQFDHCFYQYDEVQWQVAYRYTKRVHHEDQIRIDQSLLDFSLDVIRVAPEVYTAVVVHSFIRAVLHIANRGTILVPLYIFCLLLTVVAVRRYRAGPLPPGSPREIRRGAALLTLISVPAIVLFLGKVGLTVLVAMPDPRYIDPATTLLPGIITTAGYLVLCRLGQAMKRKAVTNQRTPEASGVR
jgi:hypothetical protein